MEQEKIAPPRPRFSLRVFQNFLARQAVENKDAGKLEKALVRGADPNAVFSTHPRLGYCDYTHILHACVANRWVDGVELLISHGADKELRSGKLHATPLFIAAEDRNLTMMRLLVGLGCSRDGRGWAINQAKLDQRVGLLGWDYPNQTDWVEFHETAVIDLVKANKDPQERQEILMGEAIRTRGQLRTPSPSPKI